MWPHGPFLPGAAARLFNNLPLGRLMYGLRRTTESPEARKGIEIMVHDPLREACWRFEQISPLLEPGLTASERRRMIEEMGRVCVRWPSGREAPVPRSTTYRWLRAWRKDPRIEALMPQGRKRQAKAIKPEWVQHALALLEEQADRSLFILCLRIKHRFGLRRAPSRASLQRALAVQPRYIKLKRRARGERKLRGRFQARQPHDIWHADAKGAFMVQFTDGVKRKAQVLTILDDATRFVLAALVVLSESLAAAVATFRAAAARWGLPVKFYADRGSVYDSNVFRKGLAMLGCHRINTKSRNPSAHGKIEAYHRSLKRWFVAELKHQPVRDLAHLQALLDAVLDQIYHEHVHRELKQTAREAFGNRISPRIVSLQRLREAFLIEKTLTAHKKTGEIRVGGKLFIVPERFWGRNRQVKIAIDPETPAEPCAVVKPGAYEPLAPAFPEPQKQTEPATAEEPVGPLTPLLQRYRGRDLPLAHGGFGLPEIYAAFAQALDRPIPATESEAASVSRWLADNGPFEPKAFAAALARSLDALGPGRPLSQIIDALNRRIKRSKNKEEQL
jgi:transposase InsO family protein